MLICAIKMLILAIAWYPKEFLLKMRKARSKELAFLRHINIILGSIRSHITSLTPSIAGCSPRQYPPYYTCPRELYVATLSLESS